MHCLNNPAVECSSDDQCFLAGACQPDATCFFGPPIPVNGFPASCVVNTFAADASGMIDLSGPTATLNVQLASRVYISTLNPTACPQCINNACTFGRNTGAFCETDNVNMTTLDCPPPDGTYIATLPINLNPLTTGQALSTAEDGNFCPDQVTPGAFGLMDVQAIRQQGSLNLGTLESTLVSNFCIPSTGSPSLDNLATCRAGNDQPARHDGLLVVPERSVRRLTKTHRDDSRPGAGSAAGAGTALGVTGG